MKPPAARTTRGHWTWADHEHNERKIQGEKDTKLWNRIGRSLGVRGVDLMGLVVRLIDDRVALSAPSYLRPLADQLSDPATADAARGAFVELIFDDLVEIISTLTKKGRKRDSRDPEETPGRGGEDAASDERAIYDGHDGEPEERQAGGAGTAPKRPRPR